MGDGQTLRGFNRKTGLRNRRYLCDSEYHLAPRCPWRGTLRGARSSFSQESGRSYRPLCSSISMETPVLPQKAESVGGSEAGGKCVQSFVSTVDEGEASMVSRGDSVVALDTGPTASPA